MGTWGEDLLDNDSALDAMGNIDNAEAPIDCIVGYLLPIESDTGEQSFIDSDEGAEITVAALFVIAFQKGMEALLTLNIRDNHLSELKRIVSLHQEEWDSRFKNVDTDANTFDVNKKTVSLLQLIILDGHRSELYELWSETSELEQWKNTIKPLIELLKA